MSTAKKLRAFRLSNKVMDTLDECVRLQTQLDASERTFVWVTRDRTWAVGRAAECLATQLSRELAELERKTGQASKGHKEPRSIGTRGIKAIASAQTVATETEDTPNGRVALSVEGGDLGQPKPNRTGASALKAKQDSGHIWQIGDGSLCLGRNYIKFGTRLRIQHNSRWVDVVVKEDEKGMFATVRGKRCVLDGLKAELCG